MNPRLVVVSVSVGTGLLITFLCLLLAAAVVVIHPKSPAQDRTPSGVGLPSLHRVGPIGEISSETKEAELNRNYGPVNASKLKEDKNAIFDRIRARRSSYQRPSYGSTGNARQVCQYTESSYVVPTYSTVSYGSSGGNPMNPYPTYTNFQIVRSHPMQVTPVQITPDQPTRPEIDSGTFRDGSYALKNRGDCTDGNCNKTLFE